MSTPLEEPDDVEIDDDPEEGIEVDLDEDDDGIGNELDPAWDAS